MDERGISSTPKSLSTESSRHLEARGSSESSLTVPELRTLRITPAVIAIQAPGVESHAVDGKVKTNGSEPFEQYELHSLTLTAIESTTETTAIPSKTGSVIFMRPRYSRRVQSKSEPAHRSPTSESIKCSEPPAKTTDDTTVCLIDSFKDDSSTRLNHLIGAASCVCPDGPEQQSGAVFDSETWQQRFTRREATTDSPTKLQ